MASLLLLLRHLGFHTPKPHFHPKAFPRFIRHAFSTSHPDSSSDPKPSTLSARMSFVFDQIDAIEKERSQKDQTLQRIRAWRQSKNDQQNPELLSQFETTNDVSTSTQSSPADPLEWVELDAKKEKLEVVMVHPWPEWIELMERLVQQNYLDHRRKDEDKMVQDFGFDISGVAEDVPFDFTRDFKTVQTACLNFGKDRFDIFRSLSRQDIQIMVGYGCPSADKKVVFSSKLLRKHAHLDEGDVCSSCSLRSSCERAYLVTNKEDEARTIDVMRVLLTFGFDPINGSVVNKSLMKQKSVKTVVRKLLHEVVKLSAVPIDPNLPPPVIKKPPPKVKQPPPPPRKRVGRDDVEMKKGDWLCPKCDFMNFAKNTVCLQCDAKRPKRQLLPGEWECPECNFLNYRRNMACFHCECKRPPDEFMENKSREKQHGPRARFEKMASHPEVSNAWNFNFDDDESDGADVASFECADSSVRDADSLLDSRAQGGNLRGSEDNMITTGTVPRFHEREYSDLDTNRPGTGFDDFDDEDDVESYELDTQTNKAIRRNSVEYFSELENNDGSDDNLHDHRRAAKPFNSQTALSGSGDDEQDFDSDEDLSVHPKWKSSHVANSRNKIRDRGPTRPSKQLTFGSDEELGLHSDMDDESDEDFGSRKSKGGKWGSKRRDLQRIGGNFDMEDGPYYGSKFDNRNLRSHTNKSSGNNEESGRRRNSSKGQGSNNFGRRNESAGSRRNSFSDEFNRSHGNSRGSGQGENNLGRRAQFKSKDSGGNRRNFFSDDFNRLSQGNNRRSHEEFNRPLRGGNRGSRNGLNSSSSGSNRGFGRDNLGAQSWHDKGNWQGRRSDEHDTGMDNGEPRRRRIIER